MKKHKVQSAILIQILFIFISIMCLTMLLSFDVIAAAGIAAGATTGKAAGTVAGAADQESKKEIDPHDLVFMSASELALKIQSRQVTSVEVVEAYLAQIAKYNGKLNAIVTLDIEGARQRAMEADAALARGEILGAAAWRSHNDQRQHRRRGDENHQQFARPCQLCAGL